jgi:hypothetical protein
MDLDRQNLAGELRRLPERSTEVERALTFRLPAQRPASWEPRLCGQIGALPQSPHRPVRRVAGSPGQAALDAALAAVCTTRPAGSFCASIRARLLSPPLAPPDLHDPVGIQLSAASATVDHEPSDQIAQPSVSHA